MFQKLHVSLGKSLIKNSTINEVIKLYTFTIAIDTTPPSKW